MEVTEYWRSNADGVTQTTRGSVGNILQWFAGIAVAFTKLSDIFSRAPPPVSDIAAESRAESAAEAAGAVATATEITTATPTETSAVAADAKIGQDGQVTGLASSDQQEIQRRRELVRVLFNDFWSGRDDKPATFADRLDQAEIYLNDRLSACGEYWQLDAKTRKLLGLPARRSTASA